MVRTLWFHPAGIVVPANNSYCLPFLLLLALCRVPHYMQKELNSNRLKYYIERQNNDKQRRYWRMRHKIDLYLNFWQVRS